MNTEMMMADSNIDVKVEQENGKTEPTGVGIAVGSYVSRNGERGVSIIAPGASVGGIWVTPDAARMLAKQLTDWADYAEKHQGPIALLYKVLIKKAEELAGEVDKAAEKSVWQWVPENYDGQPPGTGEAVTERKPKPKAKSRKRKSA